MNTRYLIIVIICLAISNMSNAAIVPASFPASFIYKNKPIDAYCFNLGDGAIDLNNCGAESKGYKIIKPDRSLIDKGYIGAEYTDPSENNIYSGFSYYKIISPTKNDYIIYSINSGGGSGTFTSLLLVKRIDNKIYIKTLRDGDRAQSGIDNVYVKNNFLYYTVNITPQSLIALTNLKPSLYQQLNDCMACIGSQLIYRRSIGGNLGEEKLTAIDIQPPYYQTPSGNHQNVCFAQIVDQYLKQGKRYIPWPEFQTFAQSYNACVTRPA